MSVVGTTLGTDIQPLRVAGTPVVQNHRQIVDVIRRTVGVESAALFSAPNINRATGDIQWYSPIPGQVTPLELLAPEERRDVERRLAKLVDAVDRRADELASSSTSADRLAAEFLRAALEIPASSDGFAKFVVAVGGSPVLFVWGHVPHGPPAPLRTLRTIANSRFEKDGAHEAGGSSIPPASSGLGTRPQPTQGPGNSVSPDQTPPSTSPEETREAQEDTPSIEQSSSGRWYLSLRRTEHRTVSYAYSRWHAAGGWAALTLLLLVIGWLLLKYCALGLPSMVAANDRPLLNYCRSEVEDRTETLRRRIDQLDAEIRRKQQACTPPRQVPPPPRDTNRDIQQEGGKIGAINVVLIWETDDDLDLHVVCPGGQRISYSTPSECGGMLDIDRNAAAQTMSQRPIENIVWSQGAAPTGKFVVQVNRFATRSSGQRPTSFVVELKIDGRTVETKRAEISSEDRPQTVLEFELPRN